MTRGLGILRGLFKSSESRLDGLEVLDVGHDIVPQEAQDGLLSALVGIGCDGSTSLEEKDLRSSSGGESLGDTGGLFDLQNRRRDRPEDEDHELAEANVGGGGKCLLKLQNSGIDKGEEGWLKLLIGLSTIGLELWANLGFKIFGGLEEDNEVPLQVLSSELRSIPIGLLNASAKWTPRTFSSTFVSGAE
jgi:hypothetical protein